MHLPTEFEYYQRDAACREIWTWSESAQFFSLPISEYFGSRFCREFNCPCCLYGNVKI